MHLKVTKHKCTIFFSFVHVCVCVVGVVVGVVVHPFICSAVLTIMLESVRHPQMTILQLIHTFCRFLIVLTLSFTAPHLISPFCLGLLYICPLLGQALNLTRFTCDETEQYIWSFRCVKCSPGRVIS